MRSFTKMPVNSGPLVPVPSQDELGNLSHTFAF